LANKRIEEKEDLCTDNEVRSEEAHWCNLRPWRGFITTHIVLEILAHYGALSPLGLDPIKLAYVSADIFFAAPPKKNAKFARGTAGNSLLLGTKCWLSIIMY